jgi:hypothetical protein
MSDMVPLRCDDKMIPVDIDETLMLINITGSAGLQRNIRLLCTEYIDIFSPTVRHEPARVRHEPPRSMKVDSDKYEDKRNRLSPRFLKRDKDADLRKQIALLKTSSVIEKSTASEYSQVHLVRKPDHTWRLCINFKNLNDATVHGDLASSEHPSYDRQGDATSSPSLRQSGHDIWILPDHRDCVLHRD